MSDFHIWWLMIRSSLLALQHYQNWEQRLVSDCDCEASGNFTKMYSISCISNAPTTSADNNFYLQIYVYVSWS